MNCLANLLQRSGLPVMRMLRCDFRTSSVLSKGHAKWQNIKHTKMTKDQQRSQLIQKQMRNIRLAVQEGGSTNPALNPQLKSAIDAANDRDVPQSTIKAVLKKLSEAPDTSAVNRHLFEGRLYGKLFLIISVYTDNLALSRNQLAVPIKKHHFMLNNTKHMFTERGVIAALARPEVRADHFEDDCLNDAIECGAEDIEVHDVAQRQVAFLCEPIEFVKVKQKLTSCGYKIVEADCVFNFDGPTVKLSEEEVKNYDFFKERLQQGLDGFDTIYDNLAEDDDE